VNEEQSRRQFIQGLGALLVSGTSASLQGLLMNSTAALAKTEGVGKGKPAAAKYRVSNWTGDDFIRGHQFRTGDLPTGFSEHPEKTIDVIIIGGGIAGLTSAYYLRQHDFLLLEQYDDLGGQSRGSTYKGIDYSYGAAFVDTDQGIYGQLYQDLGIAPVKLTAGDNSFYFENRWHQGTSGAAPTSIYRDFKRLISESAGAFKVLPAEDCPESMNTSQLAKLDSIPFSSMLKGYSQQFTSLLDNICKSGCCGTTAQLSALSGLYLIEDLTSSNFVFKGGNSAIAKALVKTVQESGAERLTTGAFVWKVVLNESGAIVMYTDRDGQPHTVACKHVIVTVPPMVAWRQIKNLDDRMRAALMPLKYGSYLVANCLLNKKIFNGAYDNWFSAPFSIADVTVAETPYLRSGKYIAGMGSVLTAYQPWEPGSAGRTLLLEGDRQKLSSSVHDQLKKVISQLDAHLEEIVLSRWGHAMVVPGPGYFARLEKIISLQQGHYTLAHNSTQGLPSAESAIRAARFAANRAQADMAKTTVTVP